MKIKKEIVEAIIKEEALKIKQLRQLNEEKKRLEEQLSELYNDELSEEENVENAELGFDTMEEGFFGEKLTPDNVDEKLKQKMDNYYADVLKKYPNGKRPNWSIPGNPAWEKTKQAALQLGSTDIYWNKNKGQFMKRGYSANSHTFGGGAGMEEGFFGDVAKKATDIGRQIVGLGTKPTEDNVEDGLKDRFNPDKPAHRKVKEFRKSWVGKDGNEIWEKAKKAALKYKTFEIEYNPQKKDFFPVKHAAYSMGRVGE